ncbi:hypothetical protein DSECCO2_398330 [anaerobic digester metagenome]
MGVGLVGHGLRHIAIGHRTAHRGNVRRIASDYGGSHGVILAECHRLGDLLSCHRPILIDIVHGQGMSRLRPLGIENVVSNVIHPNYCTGGKGLAVTVLLRVPAVKLIAVVGNAQAGRACQSNRPVVGD